ncbi:unnamed protein product [Symbiodinium pilosum]|uniref:Uncharacterized protein n=1 Tax=Symbiodinium pilosum TaxID=2952 RepID=A0A812JMU8_SYMPI|nr:unnamed protein product [Symbiodinium pilosum]
MQPLVKDIRDAKPKASEEFGAVDLAQSLWACATLKLDQGLAQPLFSAAAEKCTEFTVVGLSSVMWSAAALAITDPGACYAMRTQARELANRCRDSPM